MPTREALSSPPARPVLEPLDPQRLAQQVAERFRESGARGSRLPLATRQEIVERDGVRCLVRVLRSPPGPPRGRAGGGAEDAVERRSEAAGAREAPSSPFLPPYDPALLVGAISPTHVCLLNKYNVFDRHLLLVTREFERQESPLERADLAAALACVGALDGLVFYNGGSDAGASQAHKHLQLVPYPIGGELERFPFEPAIAAAARSRGPVPGWRFRHRVAPLASLDPAQATEVYRRLVGELELARPGAALAAPYNLLMTRDWMLVAPRSRAACASLDVNALGFAGAFFARRAEDLTLLAELGPLEVLRRVAVPG